MSRDAAAEQIRVGRQTVHLTRPGKLLFPDDDIDKRHLAEYYALAVTEQAAANRTFELGGPDAVSWNKFWERLKRVLGVRRPSVHVPFGAMRAQATLTERLPGAPVTRDQLTMLELGDNVVTDPSAVETFQLALVPLDEQLRRAT